MVMVTVITRIYIYTPQNPVLIVEVQCSRLRPLAAGDSYRFEAVLLTLQVESKELHALPTGRCLFPM